MRGVIHGFVNVLPYDATFNPQPSPIYIKMWLCRRKTYNINAGGLPGTNDFATFFQAGGSSAGFQSNMLDMVFKSNSDYWTCYATKTVQLQNNANAGNGSPIVSSNASVSRPFSFSFAKHLGMCRFNDNVSYPENKELFLVFQPAYADGSSSATALRLAEVHYNIEWQFEDA
jgi:hypothetical protein